MRPILGLVRVKIKTTKIYEPDPYFGLVKIKTTKMYEIHTLVLYMKICTHKNDQPYGGYAMVDTHICM